MHIAIIGSCSTALMFALKEATHRPRPAFPLIQGITNFSFPSGHTLSAFIFCSIFIYIIWYGRLREEFKWLFCTLLFLFAVTIGISRIVLKVHYPTDVIASLCLGMVWVILSFWILRRLSKRQALKLKASEPTQINP
jgi:membrane-associated phospholipid phosphatase